MSKTYEVMLKYEDPKGERSREDVANFIAGQLREGCQIPGCVVMSVAPEDGWFKLLRKDRTEARLQDIERLLADDVPDKLRDLKELQDHFVGRTHDMEVKFRKKFDDLESRISTLNDLRQNLVARVRKLATREELLDLEKRVVGIHNAQSGRIKRLEDEGTRASATRQDLMTRVEALEGVPKKTPEKDPVIKYAKQWDIHCIGVFPPSWGPDQVEEFMTDLFCNNQDPAFITLVERKPTTEQTVKDYTEAIHR